MQKIRTFLLLSAVAISNLSCNDNLEKRPIDSLGARLVAYDEGGVENTLFAANTNVLFMLNIFNRSANDIKGGDFYGYCNVFDEEEFLLIYKLIRDDHGVEWMPYGKPYNPPVYCPMIFMPILFPAEGEVKLFGAPWNRNPDNRPLTAGKYYTAFPFTLELDGQSRKHDLKLEFEVE